MAPGRFNLQSPSAGLYAVAFEILLLLPVGLTASPKTTLNSDKTGAMVAPGRRSACLMEAKMAQGTVKFFNAQKGFGFITPNDGGKDVFVHISAVERAGMSDLREGQKLSYEVISERGKLAAANLQNV
jgi:CspA family cold shock protein